MENVFCGWVYLSLFTKNPRVETLTLGGIYCILRFIIYKCVRYNLHREHKKTISKLLISINIKSKITDGFRCTYTSKTSTRPLIVYKYYTPEGSELPLKRVSTSLQSVNIQRSQTRPRYLDKLWRPLLLSINNYCLPDAAVCLETENHSPK